VAYIVSGGAVNSTHSLSPGADHQDVLVNVVLDYTARPEIKEPFPARSIRYGSEPTTLQRLLPMFGTAQLLVVRTREEDKKSLSAQVRVRVRSGNGN